MELTKEQLERILDYIQDVSDMVELSSELEKEKYEIVEMLSMEITK